MSNTDLAGQIGYCLGYVSAGGNSNQFYGLLEPDEKMPYMLRLDSARAIVWITYQREIDHDYKVNKTKKYYTDNRATALELIDFIKVKTQNYQLTLNAVKLEQALRFANCLVALIQQADTYTFDE